MFQQMFLQMRSKCSQLCSNSTICQELLNVSCIHQLWLYCYKAMSLTAPACPLSTLPAGLGKLGLETVECSQAGVAQEVRPV